MTSLFEGKGRMDIFRLFLDDSYMGNLTPLKFLEESTSDDVLFIM